MNKINLGKISHLCLMNYPLRSLFRYSSLFLLLVILHHGCRASSVSEYRHSYSYTLLCPSASVAETMPYKLALTKLHYVSKKESRAFFKVTIEPRSRKVSDAGAALMVPILPSVHSLQITLLCLPELAGKNILLTNEDPIRGPPSIG